MFPKIKEECGIFGWVSQVSINIFKLIESLKKLQHRGRESAGIIYILDNKQVLFKQPGLVKQVFQKFKDDIMINQCMGHVRYSTTKDFYATHESMTLEAQPYMGMRDGTFSLVHNGNIPNLVQIKSQFPKIAKRVNSKSDTEFILRFIEGSSKETFDEVLIDFLKNIPGVYSLGVMTNTHTYVMKDRYGVRPLVLGFGEGVVYFSSETVGFPSNIENFKEVNPGEIWKISKKGDIEIIYCLPNAYSCFCLFEYIYFMSPNSYYDNRKISDIRYELGELLAKNESDTFIRYILRNKDKIKVVGMPKSAVYAGMGYSEYLNLRYEQLIWKSKSCGRSFILRDNNERISTCQRGIKFIPEKVKGKDIILVDDTIVRGNTLKSISEKLKKAGAEKIHVRVISPPVKYPCFMGIDIPSRHELIANHYTLSQIEKDLQLDSLTYLNMEQINSVVGKNIYTGCFSGRYPPGLLD